MSLMRCDGCGWITDTDDDPESLYVLDGECLCENCRDRWARNQAPENDEMEP